ncbi:10342_t:CDS:1 [Cetraspora pellucida]|uniref:10342_t:CDS:1 n=1 Tax=Cetraspora pellucida TaxID=1433469 RepID=A0A9N9P066_9GLOM|nr:10342_t:CDS:1 [Cetraspora pellucida]
MKVVSSHDKSKVPVALFIIVKSTDDIEENSSSDPNDKLIVKELLQQIGILHVCNLMLIEDLLNLKEKQEAHYQFTDEDLIQTATKVEQIGEEFIMLPLTGEKQFNILHDVLKIVNERIDNSGVTIKSLHKLQSCI